jgi:hypothetical protein
MLLSTSKIIFSVVYNFFNSFYSIIFYGPLNLTSIFNYLLLYIILYNYHILFSSSIVNINCESQFLKK